MANEHPTQTPGHPDRLTPHVNHQDGKAPHDPQKSDKRPMNGPKDRTDRPTKVPRLLPTPDEPTGSAGGSLSATALHDASMIVAIECLESELGPRKRLPTESLVKVNIALCYLENERKGDDSNMQKLCTVLRTIAKDSAPAASDGCNIHARCARLLARCQDDAEHPDSAPELSPDRSLRKRHNIQSATAAPNLAAKLDKHESTDSESTDSESTDGGTGSTPPPPEPLAQAIQYFEVKNHTDSRNVCRKPDVQLRTDGNRLEGARQWEALEKLNSLRYQEGTYRVGDDVKIYTGDGVDEAARILEMRDPGNGSIQLQVCWLYKEKDLPKNLKKPKGFVWPGEKTYIMSNFVDVIMYDTIDSPPNEGVRGVIEDWVFDNVCTKVGKIRKAADAHVEWLFD